MENKIKTILIIFVVVLGANLFLTGSAFAQDNLVVEYWSETEWLPLEGPIFSETNFLPGQGVTRLVRVTNKSGETKRIATEAINVSDPNRLGDVLNLEIKEGGTTRYNKPLSTFFNEGEVFLSELTGNSGNTQYDFIVSFYSGAQNPFQGKSLNFDILVGFQGEEGGLLPGAGGGAGGFLPPGLTIIDESVKITGITEDSVTITWDTSYSSTSQVIYAKKGESYSFDLTKPNYGYPHAFPEPENITKETAHSVTITGLSPGATYYYRCVSHGSLAISTEYSFTTLGIKEVGEEVEPAFVPPGGETSAGKEEKEETVGGLETPGLVEVGIEEPTGLGKFLATIGAFPFNLKVILVIVGLILIGLFILWLIKKKK